MRHVTLLARSPVLYPSSSLHRLEPITAGQRDVARLSLLLQLDLGIQSLRARVLESPEIIPLVATYHDLPRMWAHI